MAHYAKFKLANAHELVHDARQPGEQHVRSNESIDPERTALNYNLAAEDQPEKPERFLAWSIDELRNEGARIRKDTSVFCSWVVTVPADVPPSEYQQFFRSTYDFLRNRYGPQNVISAYVHMDETTPHVHFKFMPVIRDGRPPRLAATELVTRTELSRVHRELQAHLESVLGHKVTIVNDTPIRGKKTIQQLKEISDAAQKGRERASEALESILTPGTEGFGRKRRTVYTATREGFERILDVFATNQAALELAQERSDAAQRAEEAQKKAEAEKAAAQREKEAAENRLLVALQEIERQKARKEYLEYEAELERERVAEFVQAQEQGARLLAYMYPETSKAVAEAKAFRDTKTDLLDIVDLQHPELQRMTSEARRVQRLPATEGFIAAEKAHQAAMNPTRPPRRRSDMER